MASSVLWHGIVSKLPRDTVPLPRESRDERREDCREAVTGGRAPPLATTAVGTDGRPLPTDVTEPWPSVACDGRDGAVDFCDCFECWDEPWLESVDAVSRVDRASREDRAISAAARTARSTTDALSGAAAAAAADMWAAAERPCWVCACRARKRSATDRGESCSGAAAAAAVVDAADAKLKLS